MHAIDMDNAHSGLLTGTAFLVPKGHPRQSSSEAEEANAMGEIVFFDAAIRQPSSSPPRQTQLLPYETYIAYQQAEAAFKALYFGRPFDLEGSKSDPTVKVEEQHWPMVQQLAETLLRDKSLSRVQVLKLLLRASLDVADAGRG
jgi:hypothetical protein